MSKQEMDSISTVLSMLKTKKQDNEFVINGTGQLSLFGKSYSHHEIKIIKHTGLKAIPTRQTQL